MADNETKTPAKTTGRRYGSVSDLIKGESLSSEVQQKYKEIENATRVVDHLALIRQAAGITQEQMGTILGLSQSAVSKLEAGRDEELTLGIIREYAKATGQRIGLMIGKPMNHVESVKVCALGIKHHLSALAGLAHQGEELEREIAAFFGEAFFNLLDILAKVHQEMPNGKEFEVRLLQSLETPKLKRVDKKAIRKKGKLPAPAELTTA